MSHNKYGHDSELHPDFQATHPQALVWVNRVLAEQGKLPVSQLHSVHDTAWSLVAKVHHESGTWYFKALAPHIGYELDVNTTLAKLFPETAATVIAVDAQQRFMLLEDLGVDLFSFPDQDQSFHLWKTALTDYAHMQVKIAEQGQAALLTLPERTLTRLPVEAMPIIERCVAIQPRDGEAPVLIDDVNWIQQYFANWSDVMADINKLSLPNSLHHGDLHGGNIAMNEKPIIFDWGDSSWSHPFVTFFISADACVQHFNRHDEDTLRELELAYLTPWLAYADLPTLTDLLHKVNKIAPLVMLLSWAYAISNKADPRTQEWESGLCTWVNEFLRLNR